MQNTFRQIIIALLLVACLGYAAYTYWPLISPLLPIFQKPGPPAAAPAQKPPAPTSLAEIKTLEAEEMEIVVPSQEVRLIDPFALRIEVKAASERPSAIPSPGRKAQDSNVDRRTQAGRDLDRFRNESCLHFGTGGSFGGEDHGLEGGFDPQRKDRSAEGVDQKNSDIGGKVK